MVGLLQLHQCPRPIQIGRGLFSLFLRSADETLLLLVGFGNIDGCKNGLPAGCLESLPADWLFAAERP